MITVVFCTRKSDKDYIDHVRKSFGHPKVEILEYVNKGEGLTKFYNKGLKAAKYDIVTFIHDDIIFKSTGIASKIVRYFDRNPDFGILGVAGSKRLVESGRWWESRKDMYGKVWHQKDGVTFPSEYSKDLNGGLEEVVVVDGVFFSVHKKRIKETFSKDVEGFHFYDVDFCFKNHLKGVKIGVHSSIQLIHKSIGETNDEWESNRVKFTEKYSGKLPVKIRKVLRPNEKLDILYCTANIGDDSQRNRSSIQLLKKLKSIGHTIHVISSETMQSRVVCGKNGFGFHPLNQPPGFKMGDGRWQIMTNEGVKPTEEGMIYKIKDVKYDVVHILNDELNEPMSRLYWDKPVFRTSYSDSVLSNMVSSEDDNTKIIDIPMNPSDIDDSKIGEIISIYESAI